jgi:hypothetical protein
VNNKHQGIILNRAVKEYRPLSGTRAGNTLEFCLADPIKSSIQLIAELIQNNQLTPCARCEKDGISMGYIRRLDAAGSLDYEECPSCNGWTVVSVEKENG